MATTTAIYGMLNTSLSPQLRNVDSVPNNIPAFPSPITMTNNYFNYLIYNYIEPCKMAL